MAACSAAPPKLRLADIFARSVHAVLDRFRLTPEQTRALLRAAQCRTAALGGHQVKCTSCGHGEAKYHSCRDRHCPTCRAMPQAKWIAERERRVLPTGHFHVVFTVPSQLRPMAAVHPTVVYELIVQSAAYVLKTLGREVLGGRLGITMVLHTWRRDLLFHPHVHCIVTSGALSTDGTKWVRSRRGYLFPVRRMAAMFRSRLVAGLDAALDSGEVQCLPGTSRTALMRALRRKSTKWVVFAKRPFQTVKHIIRYLGAYTHRVAISDRRVVSIDETGLVFRTRNGEVCRLDDETFLRRFARHVLPHGFRKIRHYGLYAPSAIARLLPIARGLLSPEEERDEDGLVPEPEVTDPLEMLCILSGFDPRLCRECGQDTVQRTLLPLIRDGPRGPRR